MKRESYWVFLSSSIGDREGLFRERGSPPPPLDSGSSTGVSCSGFYFARESGSRLSGSDTAPLNGSLMTMTFTPLLNGSVLMLNGSLGLFPSGSFSALNGSLPYPGFVFCCFLPGDEIWNSPTFFGWSGCSSTSSVSTLLLSL